MGACVQIRTGTQKHENLFLTGIKRNVSLLLRE